MAELLLQKKHCAAIGKQIHMIKVKDGEEKLTCCGDEAFCLYGQADKYQPYKKHHSTVKDACELAETLHIRNLILYHTEDDTLKNRKELYTKEGSMYYHGTLYIPNDLDEFEL